MATTMWPPGESPVHGHGPFLRVLCDASGCPRRRPEPAAGRCSRGSAQQAEHVLRHLVGLGEHGRTGLLQDLGAGQLCGFLGEIGITNTAT